MDRIKMLRTRREHEADLNVTPFMNLMIVLVPVLLLSMVFTHTAVIDLDFPSGGASSNKLDPEKLQLEVHVYDTQLVVSDARGGVIRRLTKKGGQHDFDGLSKVMQEIKRRVPKKRDIIILLEPDTDYQTLVSVMDRVRAYDAIVGASLVKAELFPVISLGDAPIRSRKRA
ncbi:MAG: biopolymer transporter ExbD [Gammaproteobacteria bacterium]